MGAKTASVDSSCAEFPQQLKCALAIAVGKPQPQGKGVRRQSQSRQATKETASEEPENEAPRNERPTASLSPLIAASQPVSVLPIPALGCRLPAVGQETWGSLTSETSTARPSVAQVSPEAFQGMASSAKPPGMLSAADESSSPPTLALQTVAASAKAIAATSGDALPDVAPAGANLDPGGAIQAVASCSPVAGDGRAALEASAPAEAMPAASAEPELPAIVGLSSSQKLGRLRSPAASVPSAFGPAGSKLASAAGQPETASATRQAPSRTPRPSTSATRERVSEGDTSVTASSTGAGAQRAPEVCKERAAAGVAEGTEARGPLSEVAKIAPEALSGVALKVASTDASAAGPGLRSPLPQAQPLPANGSPGAPATMSGSEETANPSLNVQSARLLETAAGSEMQVGLRTAEYGRIEIKTSLQDAAVGASIAVEHAGLREQMVAALPELKHSLSAQQIQFDALTVKDAPAATTAFAGSHQQAFEQRQSPAQQQVSLPQRQADSRERSQVQAAMAASGEVWDADSGSALNVLV